MPMVGSSIWMMGAALLDKGASDSDGLGHLINQHFPAGLMVFLAHRYEDVAFCIYYTDGIACLSADHCAVFVFWAVIAPFQITPEVYHFSFDRNLCPLWFTGRTEDAQ